MKHGLDLLWSSEEWAIFYSLLGYLYTAWKSATEASVFSPPSTGTRKNRHIWISFYKMDRAWENYWRGRKLTNGSYGSSQAKKKKKGKKKYRVMAGSGSWGNNSPRLACLLKPWSPKQNTAGLEGPAWAVGSTEQYRGMLPVCPRWGGRKGMCGIWCLLSKRQVSKKPVKGYRWLNCFSGKSKECFFLSLAIRQRRSIFSTFHWKQLQQKRWK